MKKCGAQNPITALDGALSCVYLDAEIDRRCLARSAMLGAGPAPAIITLTKAMQAVGRRGQAGEEATVESKAALSAVEITPEMIDAGGGELLSSGWPDDCDAFAAACLVYQAMELAASSRKERLIGVPLGK
jgi:hypothetical protein